MIALLELDSVTASYGASQALFGVDLRVRQGEVVALLGRNGMGKSTTIKCICRLLQSDGAIRFAGQDISALPSHRVAQLGIGLVPEGRRCFRDLTVAENLMAAARPGHWNVERIVELFPALAARLRQVAASLSGGEQQMVAIGRALMTNPRLLILDEATEGLAPLVRRDIWSVVAKLKDETGMSILVIDKSLRELAGICDHAVILERGKSVWDGSFDKLSTRVRDRYLGI